MPSSISGWDSPTKPTNQLLGYPHFANPPNIVIGVEDSRRKNLIKLMVVSGSDLPFKPMENPRKITEKILENHEEMVKMFPKETTPATARRTLA